MGEVPIPLGGVAVESCSFVGSTRPDPPIPASSPVPPTPRFCAPAMG
ncbi:MAG: hypothetical protein FJ086_00695 [Deltaproteobacteria bacterium]|nr:hypothetical protein [Deltaproteobacteria bacterium]